MSVQISTGANQVLSLGVSLGDLAVAFRHGHSIGNWLRAAKLDEELFESLMEKHEALLQRRGVINVVQMKKRWSQLDFIYEGNLVHSPREAKPLEGRCQDLSEFSWLMVTVITALIITLPSSTIKSLLVEVFTEILDGDDDVRGALRVQLPTNIQAWRSVGIVRGMRDSTSACLKRSQYELVGDRAIPQLNSAEQEEMGSFLVWLMADKGNELNIISPTVYSIAESMRKAGVHLNTGEERRYESEPVVKWVKSSEPVDIFKDPMEMADPFHATKGRLTRAQQISFPVGHPENMIDTIPAKRDVLNRMEMLWTMGSKAAAKMRLKPTSEPTLPFSPDSDIHYILEHDDYSRNKFSGSLSMLASHGFPVATRSILRALEELTNGLDDKRLEWLDMHTAGDYLRRETGKPSRRPENMEVFLQY